MKFFVFGEECNFRGFLRVVRRLFFCFISFSFFLCLTSCNLPASAEIVRVWIDVPLDGLQVVEGDLVQIEGHASSHTHLDRIDLLVNGYSEKQIDEPEMESNLVTFRFQWTPPGPGDYALQIIAYDRMGHSSRLDTVVVHVAAAEQEMIEVLENTPVLLTPSPISEMVIVSPSPSITQTVSEITPENTPTITPAPSEVFSATPKPSQTSMSFDTEGPPAPEIKSPLAGLDFPCISSLTLQWESVDDSSGITEYRVEVAYVADEDNWVPVEGSPFTGLSTTVLSLEVDCGNTYRWRVQAVDGYRNSGEFSDWADFAVSQE